MSPFKKQIILITRFGFKESAPYNMFIIFYHVIDYL